ncbi:MAG: transposase [Armatimonadetes bacterium]|nr:transposase [Armatimonadota bacterium]
MNGNDGRQLPARRSIRLPEYDYAGQGGYFVTIVTAGRACWFGQIDETGVALSALGRIAEEEWRRTAEMRPGVDLDAFVVMPNHLHAILIIDDGPPEAERATEVGAGEAQRATEVGAGEAARATSRSPLPGGGGIRPRGPGTGSLGAIIGGYKAAVTAQSNVLRGTPGQPVWQRNCFEHVIRSERALERLRRYIAGNPWRWAEDEENPDHR